MKKEIIWRMKKRSELKKDAKKALRGNFWKVIGLGSFVFVATLILGMGSNISDESIFGSFITIVGIIFMICAQGVTQLVTQNWYRYQKNNQKHEFHPWEEFITILKQYGQGILGLYILISLYLLLWSIPCLLLATVMIKSIIAEMTNMISIMVVVIVIMLICLIPVLIKGLSYSQCIYIYRDQIESGKVGISWRQCIKDSTEMMQGHKGEYFILQLSFIWWIVLNMITFNIASLWIQPYMYTTYAAYYQTLKQQS